MCCRRLNITNLVFRLLTLNVYMNIYFPAVIIRHQLCHWQSKSLITVSCLSDSPINICLKIRLLVFCCCCCCCFLILLFCKKLQSWNSDDAYFGFFMIIYYYYYYHHHHYHHHHYYHYVKHTSWHSATIQEWLLGTWLQFEYFISFHSNTLIS